jgi:hypothetical protein
LSESLSGRAVFGLAFDGRARAVYVAGIRGRSVSAVFLLHCVSVLLAAGSVKQCRALP